MLQMHVKETHNAAAAVSVGAGPKHAVDADGGTRVQTAGQSRAAGANQGRGPHHRGNLFLSYWAGWCHRSLSNCTNTSAMQAVRTAQLN